MNAKTIFSYDVRILACQNCGAPINASLEGGQTSCEYCGAVNLEGASTSKLATPPLRPWYRHKRGFSFEDILRAARRATAGLDVVDPGFDIHNLHQLRTRSGNAAHAASDREKFVA